MITLPFNQSFYSGAGASDEVPDRFDVALNGRPYMLDDAHQAFTQGMQSIPLLRNQADTSSEPGEQSINPEDLWPRTQKSWHHGAGQQFYDREDSDRQRFYDSVGIDPWTRGVLGVLNKTNRQSVQVETNLAVAQAGVYTYFAHGNSLEWTADASAGTVVWSDSNIQAGEAAQSVKSIASDGYTVYAALGSNGVHITTKGAVSSTHYSALSCTLLGYVKGRLIAANGNAIYNITASGAAPSALLTHPNTDFKWVGFAEGLGFIYAAGYSGDKSLIYKTAVKADGTALDIPTVAGELPDGEVITSIQGYLGFVAVGTTRGFRLATADAAGNLTFGALVDLSRAVYCFEPQDRFLWFGYTNRDTQRTGLGRMDLSIQTAENVPAYATDLMAGDDTTSFQGAVQSVCTGLNNVRVFVVSGVGLFVEDTTTKVTRAWVDSGYIDYGIAEDKVALRLALLHQPLPSDATVTAYVDADDQDFGYVGISNTVDSVTPEAPFNVGELAGRRFQVRLELAGNAKVERYDLRAYPAPQRGHVIVVPILLYEKVQPASGDEESFDPQTEYDLLEGYVGLQRPISYQELGKSFSVFVEEVNFQRRRATTNRKWWEGTAVLKLKVLGE